MFARAISLTVAGTVARRGGRIVGGLHACRFAAYLAITIPIATAHAQPASPVTAAATAPVQLPPSWHGWEVKPERYRWQIAMVDAASIVMFAGSLALVGSSDQAAGSVATASVVTYLLGGGVVHGVHGRPGRAFASVALRAVTPVVGAVVGALVASRHQSSGAYGDELPEEFVIGLLTGAGLGVASAMVIDTAFLARDLPVRDLPVRQGRVSWYPRVSLATQHVSLGVGARF